MTVSSTTTAAPTSSAITLRSVREEATAQATEIARAAERKTNLDRLLATKWYDISRMSDAQLVAFHDALDSARMGALPADEEQKIFDALTSLNSYIAQRFARLVKKGAS